jgi:hypothetical protein
VLGVLFAVSVGRSPNTEPEYGVRI